MDLKLRGKNFTKIQINKARHFYMTIYSYKYSEKLKKQQIICFAYFIDRIKLYDVPLMLENQDHLIEEFFEKNKEFKKENSIVYLIAEASKGISFAPDLNLLKNVTKRKFTTENQMGLKLGQMIAILPKIYARILSIASNSYFGLKRGEAYDFVNTYEDALKAIDRFGNVVTEETIPDYLKKEIE